MNLPGRAGKDALAFTRERPDLVAQGLRTTGYRLVPQNVRYPAEAVAGRPLRLQLEWVNWGVGGALRDYGLRLIAANVKGGKFASCNVETLETSRWVRDDVYRVTRAVTLPESQPGAAELRLALTDPETGKAFALLLARAPRTRQPIGGRRYAIGR